MAKRVELPKADAFFGAAPSETPVAAVPPQNLSAADAAASQDPSATHVEEPPQKVEVVASSRGVSHRRSDVAVQEGGAAPVAKDGEGDVEKVTLYLPPDIIKQLEVARVDLLMRYGAKVNRSRIAAAILRQTLEDISQHTPVGDRLVEALTRA